MEGNTVTDPQGILYMTANSASGSKYYELTATQQDYIAARSQNWLPSYSVIEMDADSFSITTYQLTDDNTVEQIDDTFTIEKTAGAAAEETGTTETTAETEATEATETAAETEATEATETAAETEATEATEAAADTEETAAETTETAAETTEAATEAAE